MNFFTNHTPETNYFDCGFNLFNRTSRVYVIAGNGFTWRDFIPCIELSVNGFHFGMNLGLFIFGIQILIEE